MQQRVIRGLGRVLGLKALGRLMIEA